MSEKRIIQTLMIEDNPFFVVIFNDLGKKMRDIELNIHHTISLEDSLNFLDRHREIELIILDYRLHEKITGLEILQHIRAKNINISVIVATGSGSEEIAVTMLKAGASDYLVKGNISPEVLERSIKDATEHHQVFNKAVDRGEEFILKDLAVKRSLNGVCIMDVTGNIIYINPSFALMYGYAREDEIIGNNMKSLLAPGKFAEILSSLRDKKTWMEELTGIRKDKAEISLQTLFSLIEHKNDKNRK